MRIRVVLPRVDNDALREKVLQLSEITESDELHESEWESVRHPDPREPIS